MGIYAFVFRWGHLLKSVPTHISTSMSALLCRKVGAQLRILHCLSSYIDEHSRMTIFRSFVLSNYCSLVWNFCEAAHTSKMERIPYRALICIYNDVSTSQHGRMHFIIAANLSYCHKACSCNFIIKLELPSGFPASSELLKY